MARIVVSTSSRVFVGIASLRDRHDRLRSFAVPPLLDHLAATVGPGGSASIGLTVVASRDDVRMLATADTVSLLDRAQELLVLLAGPDARLRSEQADAIVAIAGERRGGARGE